MTQLQTATTNDQAGTNELRFDLVAGLTAAAVVLPKAMAYATVAGLPVAVGLYLISGFLFGLLPFPNYQIAPF